MEKHTLPRLVSILLVLVSLSADGQDYANDLSTKNMREVKSMAKNALKLGDTYTAFAYYQEWANRKPEDTDVLYQVAELARTTRDYPTAALYYSTVKDRDIAKYPLSMYYLAQMQMNLGKYSDARGNFELFRKKYSKEVNDPKYKKIARSALRGCEALIAKTDTLEPAAVKRLGPSVNKAHIEFSPIVLDKQHIIYGSLKEDSLTYYSIQDHDSLKTPFRKFYIAEKQGDEWVDQGELKGPFNQMKKHIGNGTIRADGSRIYFTLCEKNWENRSICELYFSDKSGDGWGEAVRMDDQINMRNYTSTQPAVGRESRKNREVLYFVSDRPDGKGGMDIWYTEYNERSASFKAPRNVGSKVNSIGTEFTPYYSLMEHTLYFSSDGKGGRGGLDVFKANGEKSKFAVAELLPEGVNSAADDLGFVLDHTMQGGFLVSNREGSVPLLHKTCCDDIYEFKYAEYVELSLLSKAMSKGMPISDYTMSLYIKDENNVLSGDAAEPNFLVSSTHVDGPSHKLDLSPGQIYVVEISKDGWFNVSHEIDTREINESKAFEHTFEMTSMSSQPMTIPGIFYEFNSHKLTKEAKSAIDTTLFEIIKANPDIIIEIASHTDSKGTEQYNKELSEKRALSVVNHLAIKGIDRSRLKYKGYGESKPIAPNTLPDGSDNPEGRAQNRRTEFLVIGDFERPSVEEEDEKKKKEVKKPKGNDSLKF